MTMKTRHIRCAVAGTLAVAAVPGTVLAASSTATAGAAWPLPASNTISPPPGVPTAEGFVFSNGRYTPVRIPPNLASTAPLGIGATRINDRGQVVGEYIDNLGISRGFLLDRDRFTRIDVPRSMATNCTKINNSGQITGLYNDRSPDLGDRVDSVPPFSLRGFVLDHGRFNRIDFPGAASTQIFDVNDHGQAVGEYRDANDVFHGFLWDRGRFVTIDVPGATGGAAASINNRGQILGIYGDERSPFHGYLWDRGRFTRFDVPGAGLTQPTGINDRGTIVGLFADGLTDPMASGFVLDRGRFSVVNRPGFDATALFDINNHGQIAGVGINAPAGASADGTAMMSDLVGAR
jgi:uncharacterized membrane protein